MISARTKERSQCKQLAEDREQDKHASILRQLADSPVYAVKRASLVLLSIPRKATRGPVTALRDRCLSIARYRAKPRRKLVFERDPRLWWSYPVASVRLLIATRKIETLFARGFCTVFFERRNETVRVGFARQISNLFSRLADRCWTSTGFFQASFELWRVIASFFFFFFLQMYLVGWLKKNFFFSYELFCIRIVV